MLAPASKAEVPPDLQAALEQSPDAAAFFATLTGANRYAILYRIALTQLRSLPAAQAYVARRLSEGKTKREAIRALKRHLVRVLFRLWRECLRGAQGQPTACAA